MGKICRIAVSLVATGAMLWSGLLQQLVYAEDHAGVVTAQNDYIQYSVKADNGRFSIKNVLGDPYRPTDNDAALLYKEEEPETSFATFKIDGKDYIYGNAYGFMNLDGSFTEKPHNVDRTNTSVWSMDGVSIRQTLEIADDIKNPNIGNVRVKYEVSNNGSAVRQIGARMLLDTMLGSNDGAAFLVGGDNKPITTETSLSGDQVPTYWRSLDNLFNPAVFSYGLLSGYGNAKPSQVVFGHWNKLSETKWDYSPDANLDFTKKTNAYGAADSAVALYWNPIEIGAGETKTFETYYGTGNFSKPADGANFGLAAYAPDQLNVNEAGDGYAENEFEITAEVDNTRANNRMLSNVKASLILESGLAAVQDGTLYQTAPLIQTNGTYAFKWKVKADPQQSYAVKQYRVEIQAEGMTAPVTAGGYILLPGVHRDPPAVQYQKLAPDTVYTSGTRFITVKGQGFNVYKDLSRWSVRLENTVTGVRTELPADAADVTSDTDMMLRVEAPLDPGVYQAVITHRDFGEQRIQQTLNVSADTRYMGRYYGLLAVKKTAVDDDFIYDIVSLADEAALEQYKAGLSEDESILLDVRGEVMEKKDDSGATEYVVNTTANPAVLNSVVEYGGTPMTIRKNPHDSSHIRDYIEVSGNGPLRISGGMEFWKYEFAMEFKDGEDYALDADDDQSPVSMELAGLGKSLKMISGFGIEINGAVLHDKAVSFSGAMALTFLPGGEEKYKEEKDKKWNKQNPEYEPGSVDDSMFDFSASIDNVLFGEKENSEVGFIGIDTTLSIGLPEDFLGGMMKNEASASLTINTIDNIYGVDAQLKIKVLEFHGILTIAIQDGTPKVDDLFLSAKGEPGIMVAPDVFVTMLGGGVEDVSSISDGPGKIVLAAAIKMAEVLEGEFTLKVSRLGFSLEGGFEIAKLPFMKEVSADVQWAEPAKLELEAKLNIVDVVIGEVYIYISGERFEGYAKAAVVFPKWIPIAGGKTLAGAELGVSSESVWGSVEVIGLPVGVRYYWGQGVEFADAQGIVPIRTREGLYTERLKTEDGKPVTMVVGGNFKRITSDNNLPLQRQVASLSNADIAGLLEQTPSGTEKTQHTVAIGDQALACFEINYSGTQPQLHVYRPDGSEYVLIPEGQPNSNYLQQTVPAENSASGETEQKLFISVQAPASGNWQIVADKPVSLVGYDVTPAPKLESVQVSKVDDRQLQVDWTASNAAQSRLTVSLARNPEEAGVTIASGVDPTAGTMLAAVPEDTKSGTYYIRVSLSDGQTGQQSIYSEPIRLDDPNAPLPAEGVKAALFGDGKLDVSWTGSKSAEVTGYYVEVYDEQGSKVDTVGEKFVAADESGAIIGGQYRTDKGDTLGLPPGTSYKVGLITERKTADGVLHYSETAYSDPVFLPVPNPAKLTVTYGSEFVDKTEANGAKTKITNQGAPVLHFSSDQAVKTMVKLDGTAVSLKEGSAWDISIPAADGDHKVEFEAVNEQGDTSTSQVNFTIDTTAPPLMIDPAQDVNANGKIVLKGTTDRDSQLTVDGMTVSPDVNGRFAAELDLGSSMSKTVTIEAADPAGNKSSYQTEIVNTALKPLKKIALDPYASTMKVGDRQSFTLEGRDQAGNAVTMNPADVQWSVMMGDSIASVTPDGQLQASGSGKVIVKAAYYTTSDFAFEDVAQITVNGDTVTPNPDPGTIPDPGDTGPTTGGHKHNNSSGESTVPPVGPDTAQIDRTLENVLAELIAKDKHLKLIGNYSLIPGQTATLPIGERGKLTVPEQLLTQADAVAVAAVDNAASYLQNYPPGQLKVQGELYSIQMARTSSVLAAPVKLELQYTAENVDNTDLLGIYRYNEKLQKWQYVDGVIDPQTHTVSAEVERLGTFALMENKAMPVMNDMKGRWSDKYVKTLLSLQLADGVTKEDGSYFEPSRPITRLEFTKLITAAMGAAQPLKSGGEPPFADWSATPEWGRPFLQTAYANGWIDGTAVGDKTVFEPSVHISRVQAASILGRTWERQTANPAAFTDEGQIPSWAKVYVNTLADSGIISGYPDGSFKPESTITREEAAAMIAHWVNTDTFQ